MKKLILLCCLFVSTLHSQIPGADSLEAILNIDNKLPRSLLLQPWSDSDHYLLTSASFERMGNYKMALEYQKKYNKHCTVEKDELRSKLNLQLENNKIREAEMALQARKLASQRTFLWVFCSVILLLTILVVVIYHRAVAWKKSNRRLKGVIKENELLLLGLHTKDTINHNSETPVALHDRIFVHYNGKMIKILFDAIDYIEAARNYSKVVTNGKTYLLTMPMKNLEEQLPGSLFQRIHRSHIVNIKHVDEVDEHTVTIGRKILPLSKSYHEDFIKRISTI